MVTSWDLYWITRLDAINDILSSTLILFLIASFIVTLIIGRWFSLECENKNNPSIKVFYSPVAMCVFTGLIAVLFALTPTTKEAMIIYGVPALLQNQKGAIVEAGKVPEKTLKLFNQYLDDKLKDNKKTK